MRSVKPELLGGFLDLLPEDMIIRQKIISTIQSVYESFGFLPLDTPCMERWEVLTGGSPNFNKSVFVSRVVRGEEDKNEVISETELTLRFDLTVSLARVVAAYPDLPKPFKRYQIGKVWRGERPQQGRYREFYQFDIDTIGSRSMMADTEIIQAMYQTMIALGIEGFVIKFNNRKILNGMAERVGCSKIKELYRIIDKIDRIGLDGVLSELRRQPENEFDESAVALDQEQGDLVRQFMEIRGDTNSEVLSNLDRYFGGQTAIGQEGVNELRQIVGYLSSLNIPEPFCRVDLSVARGLDYYTGPVFEMGLTDAPEFGSVFSGGRFDGLTDRFIPGSNIPGVGASVGLDRLLAALKKLGLLNGTKTVSQVLVTVFSSDLRSASMATAAGLRKQGFKTELYLGDGPLKAQLAYAKTQEIPFVIIIGPDEESTGRVMLKNMDRRSQESLTLPECFDRLKVSLG